MTIKTMKLTFNGIDRFKARDATFFRTIQPIENNYTIPTKNIYMYSFCLKPEEHQPSGSCNFSRFDDCKLNFTSNVSIDKVFATNYNILRISSGLVNLRFSN